MKKEVWRPEYLSTIQVQYAVDLRKERRSPFIDDDAKAWKLGAVPEPRGTFRADRPELGPLGACGTITLCRRRRGLS